MKKLNLKLGGFKEMLTREQMKKVVGGYEAHTCLIKPSNGNAYYAPDPNGDGSAGNSACLAWMSLHGGSCSYDCTFDGQG